MGEIDELLANARAFAERRQVLAAGVCVAIATALFLPGRDVLDRANWGLGYLAIVVIVAGTTGTRGAIAGALLAFAAWDVFFLPPYFSAIPTHLGDWLLLATFLGVGLALALRTAQWRSRETDVRARELDAEALSRLAVELPGAEDVRAMGELLLDVLCERTGADRGAVFVAEEGRPLVVATVGEASADKHVHHMLMMRAPSDVDLGDALLLPLPGERTTLGAVLLGRTGVPFDAHERRILRSASSLAAAWLSQAGLRAEAVQAAALLEADRLKSVFVSSVSHQLKTPLASALATTTGLLEPGADLRERRVREELAAVTQDLERLGASIRDLLDLAALESDSWRPHAEPCEIGDVVGSMLAVLGRQRERVRIEVPERLPYVRGDFGQLVRAIGNVVENALAYSPEGAPVVLRVRLDGDELRLVVDDAGPGIPEAEREAVFRKFYRCEGRQHPSTSTGLGLAIAHQIVGAHDGRLLVENSPAGGARFVFALPIDWSGEAV